MISITWCSISTLRCGSWDVSWLVWYEVVVKKSTPFIFSDNCKFRVQIQASRFVWKWEEWLKEMILELKFPKLELQGIFGVWIFVGPAVEPRFIGPKCLSGKLDGRPCGRGWFAGSRVDVTGASELELQVGLGEPRDVKLQGMLFVEAYLIETLGEYRSWNEISLWWMGSNVLGWRWLIQICWISCACDVTLKFKKSLWV